MIANLIAFVEHNTNVVRFLLRLNAGCYSRTPVTCAYMLLCANCCLQILQHMQLFMQCIKFYAKPD